MYLEKMHDAIISMIDAYNKAVSDWNDKHKDEEDWKPWILNDDVYHNPVS